MKWEVGMRKSEKGQRTGCIEQSAESIGQKEDRRWERKKLRRGEGEKVGKKEAEKMGS